MISLLSERTCNSTRFDIGSEEGGGKITLWSQLVLAEFSKLEKNSSSLNLQTDSQYMIIGEGRKIFANNAAWE